METIENLKNNLHVLTKEELINLIIRTSKQDQNVLSAIIKNIIKPKNQIFTNDRINFNLKKHYAFKFMYIGKNYDGLVTQKDTKNTIEEHIFSALKKASLIEDEDTCNFSRCGRTDAGVSSVGNVFDLELRYKEGIDYIKILNNILPDDIRIIGSTEVNDDFDSRFSCLYREYKYFFIGNEMNINSMKQGCEKLTGLHNFKNFCKIDKSQPIDKNYHRRIYLFDIDRYRTINNFEIYRATIRGSAFLWHQVRCMMAILFSIGKGLEDTSIIDEMLNVEKPYTYNYEIASDLPLVLSDCQYEGIDFKITLENCADNFYKIQEITKDTLLDTAIHTFFFENFIDQIMKPIASDESSIQIYKKKNKYTKLLNHKMNRKGK